MSSAGRARFGSRTSRCAHVIERIGLAMAGASCGLFVATHMTAARIDAFGSLGVLFAMMIYGALGFYLGIDIPRFYARAPGTPDDVQRSDPVELLSAAGTFLAALAAFSSVYIIVTDPGLGFGWTLMVAGWWLLGGTMQIAAGIIARWRNGHPAQAEA